MHVKHLECVKCGKKYSKKEIRYRCDCSEGLEIIYDYGEIKEKISWDLLRERPFRHWRYREFFPLISKENCISLREGGVPLIKSKNISKDIGMKELYFKCEGYNPTGSFKDRGTTVEISKALEFGVSEIVCASTGNMGASIAAYCGVANIKARIYAPRDTSGIKLKQIKSYGADIELVNGDYTKAKDLAWKVFEEKGQYLTGDYPYRGEGEKSVGFEITDQLKADLIVCPIGNGTLLHSTWKGLNEMKEVDLVGELPRLVGVQAAGCNTVVKAFLGNKDGIEPVVPSTIAEAIACGDPLDGLKALNALKESNGIGIAVTDQEIINTRKILASKEGILAELSGAVSLAGLLKIKEEFKDLKVVCLVTGLGLRDI